LDYSKYVDPLFLSKITYIDSEGKRRVKNPYRNRKSYDIIVPSVNASGNFVFVVPERVVGKSVFVEFPGKVIYSSLSTLRRMRSLLSAYLRLLILK